MSGTFVVPVSFTNDDGTARYEDVEVPAADVMSVRATGFMRLPGALEDVATATLVSMRDGRKGFV